MTSRTKRRLAALALALGLIAAAPYLFHFAVDQRYHYRFGTAPWLAEASAMSEDVTRIAQFWVGPFHAAFVSQPAQSRVIWTVYRSPSSGGDIDLPHESITLRLACAVALAGTWLLLFVCGRLLARRVA